MAPPLEFRVEGVYATLEVGVAVRVCTLEFRVLGIYIIIYSI